MLWSSDDENRMNLPMWRFMIKFVIISWDDTLLFRVSLTLYSFKTSKFQQTRNLRKKGGRSLNLVFQLVFNEQGISEKMWPYSNVGFPTCFRQATNLRTKCDRILKWVSQLAFNEQEICEISVTVFWSWLPQLAFNEPEIWEKSVTVFSNGLILTNFYKNAKCRVESGHTFINSCFAKYKYRR